MRKNKRKNLKNVKGITLVALVVTIVVLLILTSVTISMGLLNNNNLFQKAKVATSTYKQAENNETATLNDISAEIDTSLGNQAIEITVANSKGGNIILSTDNIGIKDDSGNIVTVPAGFKIATDSATKQEDGIVIEDKDGNQYVWIPVANIASYARTDFGKYWPTNYNLTNFLETLPSDEQTSVSTCHGYYIGRYEAGDSVSTTNKTLRASGASVTNTVSIKKGQAPYNYVTRDQAITLSTGIKAAEGYKATTKLCSSYAWDTALNFIQNKISNYGTNSNQGNYKDTTFNYTDITGAIQTKALNSSILTPTGQTSSVCNIYDMGGNEWEWTTESSSVENNPCTIRGGCSDWNYATQSSGYRTYNALPNAYSIVSFRESWLVDNSHLSFLQNVFVSIDGKTIKTTSTSSEYKDNQVVELDEE